MNAWKFRLSVPASEAYSLRVRGGWRLRVDGWRLTVGNPFPYIFNPEFRFLLIISIFAS